MSRIFINIYNPIPNNSGVSYIPNTEFYQEKYNPFPEFWDTKQPKTAAHPRMTT